MRLNGFILLLALTSSGCGPSEGDKVYVSSSWVFSDRNDADKGGPPSFEIDMVAHGKLTLAQQCQVKIIELGAKWSKVEIVSGDKSGWTGWMKSEDLSSK